MKVVFRADASLQIGIGHVMRCLTLADALRANGAKCCFICREHEGNLLDQIRQRGFDAQGLPAESEVAPDNLAKATLPLHAAWLGSDWATDAEQTREAIGEAGADWLVVDHYALDARWESAVKAGYRKLMVIDDLADRLHSCDVLLDQTFGRSPNNYKPWVPEHCTLLIGSQYALLRPEFSALRDYSLKRREHPQLRHLLISMGGVDQNNATRAVLLALENSTLPKDCRITVVMGTAAPWLQSVQQQAGLLRWPVDVKIDVQNMAQLMADSDLAIGAAGSTSWERCCLGLPTIIVALAANQEFVGSALEQAKAVFLLQNQSEIATRLASSLELLTRSPAALANMSSTSSGLTDGQGIAKVLAQLEQ